MKIKYNSAQCGSGKTYTTKQDILKNTHKRYLVIVPSVHLSNEYSDVGEVIHSENSDNVQRAIFESVSNRVITITHKAFLDSPHKLLLCSNRTLVQDEHFEVFSLIKFAMDNHSEYLDAFSIIQGVDVWKEVQIDYSRIHDFLSTQDIFDNKQFAQGLMDTRQHLYINKDKIEAGANVCVVASPDMYRGANEVLINCAKFESTKQYHLWKNLFKVDFECVKEFVPYVTPNLTIHYGSQALNGKRHNEKDSSILDTIVNYVNARCKNPVYIRNKSYPDVPGWREVSHNCHGINQHMTNPHIVILSAVNYNDSARSFLLERAAMTSLEIYNSHMGEIGHQVIMRGALRQPGTNNGNECHAYVADMSLANYLTTQIFSGCDYVPIPHTDKPEKPENERLTKFLGEKQRRKLTSVEKKKACMIRKLNPEYKHLSVQELVDHAWSTFTTNGTYTKEYKEAMKERGYALPDRQLH